jgi:hypothetical protein
MVVLWVLGGLTVVGAGAVGVARVQMQRQTDREIDRVLERATLSGDTIMEADLAGLPDPVVRWMRWAGVVGSERADAVRLKQEGRFQLEGRGWFPFEADQYFTTSPPAFLWRVNMQMFPFVSVHGRDRYAEGTGSMQMNVLSLVPVVNKTGGGLDQGALLRYLGETIWFPSGVLSPFIKWEEVDDHTAMASMDYGGTVASALFRIDEEGRPVRIDAERYNDGHGEILPWTATSTKFGEYDGIRIPVEGTGVWHFGEGDFTYIDWRITDVGFNAPERY